MIENFSRIVVSNSSKSYHLNITENLEVFPARTNLPEVYEKEDFHTVFY